MNQNKQKQNNYEKPFRNQEELQRAIGQKFKIHGHKVKYKVSLDIKET